MPATLPQSFDKFTQTAELVCSPKAGELHSNSPRLWNLYLALSKGLTAKKIELYGVFLSSRYATVTKD